MPSIAHASISTAEFQCHMPLQPGVLAQSKPCTTILNTFQ